MTTLANTAGSNTVDRPNTMAHPPLLFLGFLGFGEGLSLISPFPVLPDWLGPVFAVPAIVAGLVLMAAAVHRFRAAGTNIRTPRPALTLVTGGVYRLTRNPMYLSMSLIYLGFAVWLNSLWLLLLFLPLQTILHVGVILREERYMAAKFGPAYERYCAHVARWL